MRIYYHLSAYISHRVSGLDYIDCLRRAGHEVYDRPEDASRAETVIIHDDPLNFFEIFARLPLLRAMRVIALCVWENENFPDQYVEPLRLAGEIWTPSSFSRRSMLTCFSDVHVTPHVVLRRRTSPEDLAFAGAALSGTGEAFRFFSVVDSANPRKNLEGLLRAFAVLRARTRRNVALVLKQYRRSVDCSGMPGVISIDDDLTPERMTALHKLCHAYVSAHHAEGWGLGLSEAMACGKPVIATAYSGNMDFMDEGNSLPVPYTMVPVSRVMCERVPLFRPDMRWAEIDSEALVRAMARAAEGRLPPDLPARAADITRRFSPEAVGRIMRELLERRTESAKLKMPLDA